jgi:hypothetical protein
MMDVPFWCQHPNRIQKIFAENPLKHSQMVQSIGFVLRVFDRCVNFVDFQFQLAHKGISNLNFKYNVMVSYFVTIALFHVLNEFQCNAMFAHNCQECIKITP